MCLTNNLKAGEEIRSIETDREKSIAPPEVNLTLPVLRVLLYTHRQAGRPVRPLFAVLECASAEDGLHGTHAQQQDSDRQGRGKVLTEEVVCAGACFVSATETQIGAIYSGRQPTHSTAARAWLLQLKKLRWVRHGNCSSSTCGHTNDTHDDDAETY